MTDIHKPVSLAGQVFERIEKEILLGGYALRTRIKNRKKGQKSS